MKYNISTVLVFLIVVGSFAMGFRLGQNTTTLNIGRYQYVRSGMLLDTTNGDVYEVDWNVKELKKSGVIK